MTPRRRARRNLLLFWLVVVGIPVLLIAGCVIAFTPCCVDPPTPTSSF